MVNLKDVSAFPRVVLADSQLIERTIRGLHAALLERIPELESCDPILDIGCGTGAWLDRLGREGFTKLHGIDLDVDQFATSRASATRANLDYDDLGLGDQKFRLICAIELLEHLENPGRLFHHVSRHLTDDGWFLVTTPNIHSVLCRLRFLLTGKLRGFDNKGDPTHIYPVLLTSLDRILPRHGLRIEKRWSYPKGQSKTSRPITRVLSSVMRWFVPDEVSGDILCLLIRK